MKKSKVILCSLLSATIMFGTLGTGTLIHAEGMDEDQTDYVDYEDGDYEDGDDEGDDEDYVPYIPQASGYSVKKISNPDSKQGEADGLIEGGDRENSYTWRMAQRGDYIYIATTRNIASALVNMYGGAFAQAGISSDELWDMINAVTNGDIQRNDANEGANIISYNRVTGEFEVIYTAGTGDYFRMAVTFGDNVYFGSYSALPTNPQYILKLDTEGNFTKVFETTGSVSLRANCVYDDHLFFAGADDRETVADGDGEPTKMAVLMKSNEDDTVWDRVADYKDFGEIAYDSIMSSWAGAPVWELANHNGYIYATAPSTNGFVIFKGHPADDGEEANEYGWYWEEVAGLNNGINNPGLSDIEGGEPGTMRSLIGSVYEFNGELYAYNFDHAFGGEAAAMAGVIQQLGGADVKPSDYLAYMYDSLHNPQKIWKLDDETGKFEENKEFTQCMKDTTNEYIWRIGEYDDEMYIATMDAGVFYSYLTQLTDGSFIKMTSQEKIQKLGYVNKLIKLLTVKTVSAKVTSLKEKLESLKGLIENFDPNSIFNPQKAEELLQYNDLIEDIKEEYADAQDEITEAVSDSVADYIVGDGSGESGNSAIDILPSNILEMVRQRVKAMIDEAKNSGKSGIELIKDTVSKYVRLFVNAQISRLADKVYDSFENADWDGIEMYAYISKTVRHNEPGFDLYRTRDGFMFEYITRNGFDDKYNYGCSAFLTTDEGLYIGTCNPFYGGQLYLLRNDPSDDSYFENDDIIIGNTAVLHLATKNYDGNCTYTVRYKKMSSESWVTIAEDTSETTVSFTPKAAVDYDIEIETNMDNGKSFTYGRSLRVNKHISNTSVMMADTIKLGEKVKVRTRAAYGTGDYEFAVYYKKSSSEKWSLARAYSDFPATTIVPATATTYDVRVYAKDAGGEVAVKNFTLNVTK